ncbi:hypothetical protein BJG92_02645 [Arthrobacter sp. SO5]|nr:hypothetical protein [Arthrobacter sp. SO5]
MQTAYERVPTIGRVPRPFLDDATYREWTSVFNSESGGSTTVDVELDSEEEFVAMFDDAWPLAKLKAMVEYRS